METKIFNVTKSLIGFCLVVLLTNTSYSSICYKNGRAERFGNNFEPCENYWDSVFNDDGSIYKGPWAVGGCFKIKKPDANNTGPVVPLNPSNFNDINENAILDCELDENYTKKSGYALRYNSEIIGYYKNKKSFNKFKASKIK